LQAVLLSRQLFQKGVTSFPSNKTAAFYALLMRSGKDIPDNLSGKDCLARLKLLDEPITLDLMPRALPALLPPPRSNDQIMDDPDIDGDDAVDVPLPALRAPHGAETLPALHAPLVDVHTAPSDDEVDGDAGDVVFPTHVCGVPMKREAHRPGFDDGLRVFCPTHPECNRFRSLRLDADVFGQLAPVHFLGAWLQRRQSLSREGHRDYIPTRADVREYIKHNT